jgi:hypothetical protein
MDKLLTKEELLENAIKSLTNIFDIKARTSKSFGLETNHEIDLEFNLNGRNVAKTFNLEIKMSANHSIIGQMIINKDYSSRKPLLVTNYVSPPTAEKLRELNISFLDTKGNAFFNEDEFYIFISSQAKVSEIKQPKPNLIFQQSGLQLLFVLLSIPESGNFSYRVLAKMSSISLGSVNEIMAGLARELYLVSRSGLRFLVRKDELLKRWVQGYSEILRRKLIIGRFSSFDSIFTESESIQIKESRLKSIKTCWSGEFAAGQMTNYLYPEIYTLFSDPFMFPTALPMLKLRPQPNGNIEIFQRFWKFDQENTIAPPILIYADLVASADSRNLEVAKIIYDEHLVQLVE